MRPVPRAEAGATRRGPPMTFGEPSGELVSKTLRGEWVGLKEIDDGIWSLYYGSVLLARFDEREMRFYG